MQEKRLNELQAMRYPLCGFKKRLSYLPVNVIARVNLPVIFCVRRQYFFLIKPLYDIYFTFRLIQKMMRNRIVFCCNLPAMTNVLNEQLLSVVTPASIKRGDQEAFLVAYNNLHIKVFRFFLKRVLLNETAKDLTQQSFIRLWQFRHTLSEEHTLEKQVFVIAHSLLVNHFEKEYHQKKIKSRHTALAHQQPGITSFADGFERVDEVKAAIELLPPVRKKILVLKTFHDFSNHEIAREMKISVKTVEDHISKAFRRMKEVMIFILIPLLSQLLHPVVFL
jgi:RNA polymerase sigma-70 factor (ECF subfamily)